MSVQSSDEWFPNKIEQVFCFGCKRMAISAKDRDGFLKLLPDVVKANAMLMAGNNA